MSVSGRSWLISSAPRLSWQPRRAFRSDHHRPGRRGAGSRNMILRTAASRVTWPHGRAPPPRPARRATTRPPRGAWRAAGRVAGPAARGDHPDHRAGAPLGDQRDGAGEALERAFAPERLAAVALLVNSPGGSPTQSALVADRIRGLAAEKGVPVLAFCEDVAASGGYWLACAADEIYAHPTSLVGSIGVISQGFGLDGLIERFGVQRRLYTAGDSKSRLDPFLPEKPEDVEWLRGPAGPAAHDVQGVGHARGAAIASARTPSCSRARSGPERRPSSSGWSTGWAPLGACSTERFPDAELVPVEGRKPLLARLGLGPPGGRDQRDRRGRPAWDLPRRPRSGPHGRGTVCSAV